MPRTARQKSKTNIYHVVIKGIDRHLLFEETADYKKYLELLTRYKEECNCSLYAYCLMSNHVHLIINTNGNEIERIFRKLNSHYARWYNKKYQRTGPLQDNRYYSQPVEDERALRAVIHYVHNNPCKAKLEPYPGADYIWSSLHEYRARRSNLTETNEVSQILGDLSYPEEPKPDSEFDGAFWDIDSARRTMHDDAAQKIIEDTCGCSSVTEFEKLPRPERDKNLAILKKRGLTYKQLVRLTGTPKKIIENAIKKARPFFARRVSSGNVSQVKSAPAYSTM